MGADRLRLLAAAALIVAGAGVVVLNKREPLAKPTTPPTAFPVPEARIAEVDGLDAIESSSRESLATPAEEPAIPVNERKPIVLLGTVTDRSGKPIDSPRARMRVTDAHGNVRLAPILAGSFAIDRLQPGEIELGCEAVGYRPRSRTITLRTDEREHREDFELESGWVIAIRFVTPDGRNLFDFDVQRKLPLGQPISVVVTEDPPGERLRSEAFVGRAGHAWFPKRSADGTAGSLDVRGDPPIQVSAELRGYVLATRSVETQVNTLTLEIPVERLRSMPCSIVGRVIDERTRLPIPGAEIGLIGGTGTSNRLKTDDSGEFHARVRLPGEYTLTIHAPECAYEVRLVDLRPGVENDLGTIELGSGVALRGKFVDPEGRPAQAEAGLYEYSEERKFEAPKVPFEIGVAGDEDGSFEEEHLAPGKYVLLVRPFLRVGAGHPDWLAPPLLVDLTSGPIDDLVVPVHTGVELLLRPTSDEVRDLGYWIMSSQSLPDRYGCFAGSGVVKERMAPGSYKLLLGRGGKVLREIPFSISEEPMSLDVDSQR